MSIINKISGIILALLLIFIGFVVLGDILGFSSLFGYLSAILMNKENFFPALLAAVLFFVFGLALLFSNIRSRSQKSVKVKATDGNVHTYISVSTIDGIVRKIAATINGVESVKPEIISNGNSVRIFLKTKVYDELQISDISGKLQKAVTDALTKDNGVLVKYVKVLVVKTTTEVDVSKANDKKSNVEDNE